MYYGGTPFPRNPKEEHFFEDIVSVAEEAFPLPEGEPEILGVTDDVVIAENIGSLLQKEEVIVVCLEDEERALSGFSVAMPLDMFDPLRTMLKDVQHETVYDRIAYGYYAAIRQDLRGNRLVGALDAALHHRLIDQDYQYLVGDLVLEGGYAQKAKKAYGDSVIDSVLHAGYPGTGPQMRLFVDLSNPKNLPGFKPGNSPGNLPQFNGKQRL